MLPGMNIIFSRFRSIYRGIYALSGAPLVCMRAHSRSSFSINRSSTKRDTTKRRCQSSMNQRTITPCSSCRPLFHGDVRDRTLMSSTLTGLPSTMSCTCSILSCVSMLLSLPPPRPQQKHDELMEATNMLSMSNYRPLETKLDM